MRLPHPNPVFLLALSLFLTSSGRAEPPLNPIAPRSPALMLAEVYRPGIDPSAYWLSEKLDGVRAYWKGRELVSRRGNVYRAPAWFTQGFPPAPLDGELWSGRGSFEPLFSTVRKQTPVDAEWRDVRFMVFDLPAAGGTFGQRLAALKKLTAGLNHPYLAPVEQTRIGSHEALMKRLNQVVAAGGEGLMLHRDDAPYRAGRSGDLLKENLIGTRRRGSSPRSPVGENTRVCSAVWRWRPRKAPGFVSGPDSAMRNADHRHRSGA